MNRTRLFRVLPLLVALGVLWWLNDAKGRHSVELMFALPGSVTAQTGSTSPALTARVLRPDGTLVLGLEGHGMPGGRAVILPTKLSKGNYRVEAWLAGSPKRLTAQFVYGGEDAVEVDLDE